MSFRWGDLAPEILNGIVEIPMGEVNKYEYDKRLRIVRLDRALFSPVHYPGDYGFFPQTRAEDGDPFDMLVLVAAPSFPGCLVEVRPVGVLEMLDRGGKDERSWRCAPQSALPRHSQLLSGLSPCHGRDLALLQGLKDLEGKRTQTLEWRDAARRHGR